MVHEGGEGLTDVLEVWTAVKKGCFLSPFMFLLRVDWVMKTSQPTGKIVDPPDAIGGPGLC